MIIQRDNSPERYREYEQMYARSLNVDSFALEAEAVLYREFEQAWGQHAAAAPSAVPSVANAASVIDHAFLRANIEAQSSQLASDRAVTDAQRRVEEVFDDFPA